MTDVDHDLGSHYNFALEYISRREKEKQSKTMVEVGGHSFTLKIHQLEQFKSSINHQANKKRHESIEFRDLLLAHNPNLNTPRNK
jgi:hypothetical protein